MFSILNYKFYLNFKNEGSFGRIEITEPNGFDGLSFIVEQDSKRYGRDAYKINEEISLTFYKGNFDTTESSQELPNGTVIYNLTQGYEWIIESYNKFGFESDVDFEIELNGATFVPSNLDFQTSETDGYSYFSCKALQESNKQLIKRRADIVTDIFSTEDLDGNTVTPAVTENILLKAKPVTQVSEWNCPVSQNASGGLLTIGSYFFNGINGVLSSGIENTLYYIYELNKDPSNNVYIEALNDLTNLSIIGDNISFDVNGIITTTVLIIKRGSDFDTSETILNEDLGLGVQIGGVYSYSDISFDIEINLARGEKIWIYFGTLSTGSNLNVDFISGNIKAKGTSTAIDTVIKGVRYIDVIKSNIKRINGYDVVAPRYDTGGEYYDQFALTGNLIKQRDDVSFSVTFKDLMADMSELNSDYQIKDDLYIGQYTDFYANNEIGVLISPPDSTFKSSFNERYAINEFGFKYQTFEQDDSESNTTDAIHTETQWITSNLQVENKKEIIIKYIRGAFKLEKTRKDASKDTTSTTDDDKMFLLDVTRLAPNTTGGFSALMTHNINDNGQVQLLKDSDLPSWSVLGFGINNPFFINSNDNLGQYTVASIENTIITLNPKVPDTQSFSGESYTEVVYFYTNVSWVNRTNEGLLFSENLLNADNYSNLKYSIKRNLNTWKPYIDTALTYKPNGTFKNTYFKDNGEATTRFQWENENIKENATINKDELNGKVITATLYETTLIAPFEEMSNIIDSMNTVNDDNTIGGFIRCVDNSGKVIRLYPQKLDYMPSTETLKLTGEQKYDGEGVDIIISGDTITINEVGYDSDILSSPFYEFDGDYFKIYDVNNLPVINPTKYDEITVNGLSFGSSSDLLGYLVNI